MKKKESFQFILIPYRELSKLKNNSLIKFTENIIKGNILIGLEKDYPNILQWYQTKVLPGLETGEREIIFACKFDKNEFQNSQFLEVLGYVILKKTPKEKKICTIRVEPQYRNMGIGEALLKRSFIFLDTSLPMITISEDNIKYFKKLLEKYKFRLIEKKKDLYIKGKIEYIYNERWEK